MRTISQTESAHKTEAAEIAAAEGITHTQALDRIAQRHRYKNWAIFARKLRNGATPTIAAPATATAIQTIANASPELAKVLGQLDALVGQEKAKAKLRSIAAVATISAERVAAGLEPLLTRNVFAVVGDVGTGTTTFARQLAAVLKATGQVSSGHVVEVTRADLVGAFFRTANKTAEVVRQAKGGVLVVEDFDWSLLRPSNWRDAAHIAIHALRDEIQQAGSDIALVFDVKPWRKNLIGQPDTTREVFAEAGFDQLDMIELEPLGADDRVKLFAALIAEQGYTPADGALGAARLALEPNRPLDGEVRAIHMLFMRASIEAASRLSRQGSYTKADLSVITGEDVRAAAGLSLAA